MNPDRGSSLFRWAPLVLGLAVLWIAYLVLFGPRTDSVSGLAPPSLTGTRLQDPADFTWALHDLDDQPVDFAQFRGRPIVLNLWATWCPPCRAEMPSLAALAADARIKEKGVAVVCVSDESVGTLKGFVSGKSWTMTMLKATSIPAVFATDGIPATFLIAPDGKIVASEVGAARWDDPSVISFLTELGIQGR